MICRKCSETIPDEAIFCPSCGAKTDGTVPCPKCNKPIPDSSIFCIFCGERIDGKKPCPKCKKPVPIDAIFCTYCRAKLDEKQTCSSCGEKFEGNFCPKCGTPIEKTEGTKKNLIEDNPTVEEVSIVETIEHTKIDSPDKENNAIPAPVVVATTVVEQAFNNNESDLKKIADSIEDNEPIQIDQPILQAQPIIVPVVVSTAIANEVGATTIATPATPIPTDKKDETEVLNAIVCTQCGSPDVDILTKDMAKCRNCGAQIMINSPKEVKNVNNTVHVHVTGDNGKTPISFYALPELVSSQDFLSNALCELALDKETPEDIIDNSEFSPVDTQYRQYLIASGTANMSYSATVGYDYKVTYTEYVNGKPQQKTRTETKWEPFSGTLTDDYTQAVANDDDAETSDPSGYLFSYGIMNEAVELSKVDFATEQPSAPTQNTIADATSTIKRAAERDCERSLPGHRHQQFCCSGSVKLDSMECHVAPQHILEYKYKEQSKKLYAHTFSTCLVRGEKINAKKETANEIEEQIKLFNFLALGLMLLSIIVSLTAPFTFLVVIFGLLGIGSFVFLEVYRSLTKKAIYKKKRLIKIKSVINYLKNKDLNVPQKVYDELNKISESPDEQPSKTNTEEETTNE